MTIFSLKFGPSAYGALLRATVDTDIEYRDATTLAERIFRFLDIKGKDGYEHLLYKIRKRENSYKIISLVESYLDHEKFDLIFDFISNFLSLDCESEEILNIRETYIHTRRSTSLKNLNYIDIVEEDFEDLREDFKLADHLQVIPEIYDNDETGNNLLFASETKETGLLAFKYLSSEIFKILKSDYSDSGSDKIEDIIPIIYAHDMEEDTLVDESYTGNQMYMKAVQRKRDIKFWLEDNSNLPVIVIIEGNKFIPEDFLEKLEQLQDEFSTIYLLYVNDYIDEDLEEVDDEFAGLFFNKPDLDKVIEDVLFKLNYTYYDIGEAKIDSEYMETVFKDYVWLKGYKIDKNLHIGKILKKLKEHRKDKWEGNITVNQGIDKAITLKRNNSRVLENKDFKFLEENLRELRQPKKEKGKKTSSTSVLEEIDKNIYGLENVKRSMMNAINAIEINKAREKLGLKTTDINNIFAFYGAPGVGKTEIAKYFGKLMVERGLLPGDGFISISGAGLKGKFVGHTAPKIREIFMKNDIIFIDEIYGVATGSQLDSYSEEALAELCIQFEENSKDKLILVAGYGGSNMTGSQDKMKEFLDANPGIQSRITFNIDFPKYSADNEMPHIFEKITTNGEYILEDGWRDIVVNYFSLIENRKSYGNAREARRLLQQAINIQSTRVVKLDNYKKKDLMLLKNEDIEEAIDEILKNDPEEEDISKRKIGFKKRERGK